ncbi:Dam family site-specific DNA-(adenine-N6)-methyltransferase [Pseudomonas aeruginosa]|uniref:DNA adenine methylase n=1 Tax=Pseudomonas aeruginosa TaxID=287 RepID=UPI001F03E200|nr:Dam family site-specific DNA-(adenine-N6)-methyltransferase [Pseudomonas aeruginosa]ELT9584774.1 Dam family site-specific DNA-(adenine-N6)-methyltransferase [Pseudomonas aeruginosa]MDO5934732.1 Dam family site-specific DNA-(adenine-N6)-methyltransferase [Pseudomonas aeruginosa]MDO5951710.1 Dam family site-specific DNA-(adenine-N6)-methyltransferase [Pseudomonas aeruginosa]MDU0492841.1 Dam family site-specific DNA-(adenine-N6)-methyltransferase [Pseudomonas aeruginosa]HCP6202648.1 Dam family
MGLRESRQNNPFDDNSSTASESGSLVEKLCEREGVAAFQRVNKSHHQEASPFLKWAGGKRWLVEKHSHLLNIEHERYIEPFVGSGAVFFSLLPTSAILCDKNERLIEVYEAIKNEWKKVADLLQIHHRKHSPEYYYQIRLKRLRTPETRAAQFIYLNRTCWNGLYRVNKNGEFNVPIGTKKNVVLATDDFEKIARHLKNTELFSGDFEIALEKAGRGDFVFIDPPYTVKHNYNGFLKYNESIFSWEDQIRLRHAVERAVLRGAKVLVTNACHDSIKRLYENLGEISTLNRASIIAGKSSARGRYEEVVIKCY